MKTFKQVATSICTLLTGLHAAGAAAATDPTDSEQAAPPSSTLREGPPRGTSSIDGRWLLALQTDIASAHWLRRNGDDRVMVYGGDIHQTGHAALGYGLTEQLLLSGGVLLTHVDFEDERGQSWSWRVEPALSYLLDGDVVRPYFGVQGIGGGGTSTYYTDMELGAGVHGGARLGISEHLSIDPILSLRYFQNTINATGLGPTFTAREHYVSATGGLRFSAWL